MSTWKEAEARALAGGTITSDELDEIIAKGGSRTAEESERLLRACPEWVAMRAKQDADQKALEERALTEQELLTADLRRAGYRVKWVWDLVNTAESYPDAIPVLLNHLRRPYSDGIKEGIVRALTVREARGIAGSAMIEMLHETKDAGFLLRAAVANALTVVADRANRDAINALIETETNEDVRTQLKRALKTAAKP